MHTFLGNVLFTIAAMTALGATGLAGDLQPSSQPAQTAGERLFAVKLLPLLKAKCFACHGDDRKKLKGEFDLRSRAGMLKGGGSGKPAIVPHKPEESLLYQAVKWEDLEMPPKENDRLSAEQIAWIQQWIAAGAPWPDENALERYRREEWASPKKDGIRMATSGGLSADWTQRPYRPEDVWAFQPVKRAPAPQTAGHPIDAFIDAKLAAAQVRPAPRADPRTLILRASYDLLGLPPSLKEIDDFHVAWKQDPNQAWRDLIERLLASPHYGERWGQHWLDVVRYADTSGYSNDWERSNVWRYRDYVIRSFNDDKPYDRFIVEQLAGDELEPDDPEMLVAVGFLRMGPWEHTAMSPAKVSRQLYLDDMVNSIGQTFLSTALRCCKCHDHKFDPIPTRDYYRVYAALATTQLAERPAGFLPRENTSGFAEGRKHVTALLDFAKEKRGALHAKREAAARQWYAERGQKYLDFQSRLKLADNVKPPRFAGLTTAEEGELRVREQDVRVWQRCLERFEPLAQSVYSGGDLHQQSEKLRMPDPKNKDEMAKAGQIPQTHIYSGGSVFSPAGPVTPGVLSGLSLPVPSGLQGDRFALSIGMDQRRLGLARWIANPANPLATRSIVNRIWHYHFGRGLAGNPNNFGTTGKKPTHPELLDWLAAEFVDQGWSIKQLHRRIMTSQTYQRASVHPDIDALRAKDPNNHLLAVFEPRRLTAEELRDTMLAVSGELNREMGGVPARPEINREVALAPRKLQISLAPGYQPSRTPQERNRRSIYALRVRGLPDPLLEVFNQPGGDESCELRNSSSATPQVFTLMNSAAAINRSLAMALRLEREAPTPQERVQRGYQLALGSLPSETIRRKLLAHYEDMAAYHREHRPQPVEYPRRATRSLVEKFSGDTFEYEERFDIYENYLPDKQGADVSAETRALADVCLLLFNSNGFIFVY